MSLRRTSRAVLSGRCCAACARLCRPSLRHDADQGVMEQTQVSRLPGGEVDCLCLPTRLVKGALVKGALVTAEQSKPLPSQSSCMQTPQGSLQGRAISRDGSLGPARKQFTAPLRHRWSQGKRQRLAQLHAGFPNSASVRARHIRGFTVTGMLQTSPFLALSVLVRELATVTPYTNTAAPTHACQPTPTMDMLILPPWRTPWTRTPWIFRPWPSRKL